MANTIPATLRVVADNVIASLKPKLAPLLKGLSTNISAKPGQKSAILSVYVPTAATAQLFAGSYASILNNVVMTEKTITLGEPLVAASIISDTEEFLTNTNIVAAQADELAYALQKKILADFHDLIVNANFTQTSVLANATHTYAGVGAVSEKAETYGFGANKTFVVNPAAHTILRADATLANASAAGGDMVRTGNVGKIHDINVICYQDGSWGNSENLTSFVMDSRAIIAASRVPSNSDLAQAAGVTMEVGEDPETGIGVAIKYWYDSDKRAQVLSAETYFKFGIGNPAALHRFTAS